MSNPIETMSFDPRERIEAKISKPQIIVPPPPPPPSPSDGEKKSQCTILLELTENMTVFHDEDRTAYIIVPKETHREIWPIRSGDFRNWLGGLFYKAMDRGCSTSSIADALNTLEAKAVHDGNTESVYLRIARKKDVLYVDLCDKFWRVLEITAHGWNVLEESPVYFTRKKAMTALPLPAPANKADIYRLKEFLNTDDNQFLLALGWLLGAYRGIGPYPVLVLQGEQGTGKSTTSRVLRSLIDPSTVPLRSPPKQTDDLLISAINNHVVCLDNLSGLCNELSDALCRISTGGGIDKRQLFSDSDQVLVDIQKPILVNGIDDIATRPDLSERSIIVNLAVIQAEDRVDEGGFWQNFDAAKPVIFAGILNALVSCLKHEASAKRDIRCKPRMADFACWIQAAESGLGIQGGSFMRAYTANQDQAVEMGLDASPVGSTLLQLLEDNDCRLIATPTELFEKLTELAGVMAKSRAWPLSVKGLKNAIERLKPSLRRIGVEVMDGRTMTSRRYQITWIKPDKKQASTDDEGEVF